MTSPFDYGDRNLSKLTSGETVEEIKHIDDACVQILSSDNNYTVIDGGKASFGFWLIYEKRHVKSTGYDSYTV